VGPGGEAVTESASDTESGLLEILTLERIEDNYFRTGVFSSEPRGLYGGQVAAQALRAGAETVPAGWHAHSSHGYSSAAATRHAQ
jgi:acyl-CoA thioesterase-2